MAGDWIKMRTNLETDPRVIGIAAQLGTCELHVVGMLWKVWSWADSHSLDGNALCVTEVTLDRFVDRAGFAVALRKVGWLEGRDNALTFPRFAEHNGQTAKKRGETQLRVAKHRKKNGNANSVTDVTQEALPEKRREECITSDEVIHPPTPPGGESECGEPSEPKGRKKRKPLSRSTGPASGAIAGIEVDGQLLMYDDDPLVWEAAFIRWWNSQTGVIKRDLLTLDTPMRSALVSRLAEGDWFWKRTEGHFPLWTPSDWKPNLGWFLEPASVSKILNGNYEPRTNTSGLFGGSPRVEPGRIRTGATSNAIEQAFAEAAAEGH